MTDLVVATKNKKKLEEIREILKNSKIKISSLTDYPKAIRIIENGRTFKANAVKKALKCARVIGKLTLGEDSGLIVDALDGKPGIYSSRFSGPAKDDNRNNQKVLRLLGDLALKKRKAQYVCAVALADKDGLVAVVEGVCRGLIGFSPKGNTGFGYDPLFFIPRYKRTFAELGPKIKHKMSHRYRALEKIKKVLLKYIEKHESS